VPAAEPEIPDEDIMQYDDEDLHVDQHNCNIAVDEEVVYLPM
jgi:hypothetical protein